MKKKVLVFLFILVAAYCFASKTQKYILKNGIPVYIKNDDSSRLTALYVVIKGGVEYLTPETSGLEDATLSLMALGSEKFSYEDLKSFTYETQGGFSNYSINDGSVFGMSCIEKYFDKTFERFSDCFFKPNFAEREYNLLMQEFRQSVASSMNEPAGMLSYYMKKIIYQNHIYEADTSVTQDSVDNITLSAIKNHYETLIDSRRISIVASGKVESENIVKKLNETFGLLTARKTPLESEKIPPVTINGAPVILVQKNASGAGIALRSFVSPNVDSPDYPVARIVSNIFSDVLFNVVREKYGICYTPSSSVSSSDAAFGCDMFYRITDFEKLPEAYKEAVSFMEKGTLISGKNKDGSYATDTLESRLQGYKNSYINKKYSTQATVGGVASRMAASLLQFGDIDSADNLTEIVKKCTAEDVLRVFKKYWQSGSCRWFAVVGTESEEKAEKILSELTFVKN